MRTIWITGCHRCEAKGCVTTGHGPGGIRSHCTECGHYWPKYQDYVTEYQGTGLPGPYPTEVKVPLDCVGIDPAYPGSEEMSSEIADLILLVKKQFLADISHDLAKICYGRGEREANKEMWNYLSDLENELGNES